MKDELERSFDEAEAEYEREMREQEPVGMFCNCPCGCRPHTGDFGPCDCQTTTCRCKTIPQPFCTVS